MTWRKVQEEKFVKVYEKDDKNNLDGEKIKWFFSQIRILKLKRNQR